MSDTVINHINVSYDESDERVRNFVKYLKNENRKEEIRNNYQKARQNPEGKLYLSDEAGNEFTLVCTEMYNCTLGLRGM